MAVLPCRAAGGGRRPRPVLLRVCALPTPRRSPRFVLNLISSPRLRQSPKPAATLRVVFLPQSDIITRASGAFMAPRSSPRSPLGPQVPAHPRSLPPQVQHVPAEGVDCILREGPPLGPRRREPRGHRARPQGAARGRTRPTGSLVHQPPGRVALAGLACVTYAVGAGRLSRCWPWAAGQPGPFPQGP